MLSLVASEIVNLGQWAIGHREQIAGLLHGDWGTFAQSVFSNPSGTIGCQGSCLLYQPSNNDPQLLGFFEQATGKLDSIQENISSISAIQEAAVNSISSLQTISLVSLGFSAITPVLLLVQNRAITNRLKSLEKKIALIHEMLNSAELAKLDTALEQLFHGRLLLEKNGSQATTRFNDAWNGFMNSMNYSCRMLRNLSADKSSTKEQIRTVSRYLMVAILGAASCQVGLMQDQMAFSQSKDEMELLRTTLKTHFQQTIASDPSPYLLPAMADHGITLDSLIGLYRQAELAGVIARSDQLSASSWFEENRAQLFRAKAPLFPWRKRTYLKYRSQFQETVAFLEEYNRILGLERMVEQMSKKGKNTLHVLTMLQQAAAEAMKTEKKDMIFWDLT